MCMAIEREDLKELREAYKQRQNFIVSILIFRLKLLG